MLSNSIKSTSYLIFSIQKREKRKCVLILNYHKIYHLSQASDKLVSFKLNICGVVWMWLFLFSFIEISQQDSECYKNEYLKLSFIRFYLFKDSISIYHREKFLSKYISFKKQIIN